MESKKVLRAPFVVYIAAMTDVVLPSNPFTAAQMAPELSDAEKQFRDKFVEEYVKDYDYVAAAIRLGFSSVYAQDFGKKFMGEPYVQQRIASLKEDGSDYVENADKYKKRIFGMLMREASDRSGTQSARVTALSKMADFLGMNAPIKTQSEVTVGGGVTFYIPSNGRDPQAAPAAQQPQEGQ